MMVHADVLSAKGDLAAAEDARARALDLYDRKGNVMAADRARAMVKTV
jgi:hypothetical protein